jgi:hypothetical protein
MQSSVLFGSVVDSYSAIPHEITQSVRIFQTRMNDQQLAATGLLIVNRPDDAGVITQFIGSQRHWHAGHPVLLPTNFATNVMIDTGDHVLNEPVAPKWLAKFEARLVELDECAVEDEIEPSPASRAEAFKFAASLQGARLPGAFLVGNGNFRLRWQNKQNESVGLQFLGQGKVQYLFMKLSHGELLPHQGIAKIAAMSGCITSLSMRHVIAG